MRKLSLFSILAVMLLTLSCNRSHPHPVIVAKILSDQLADGDIALDSVQQTYTITNGPNTLYFGIDDSDPNLPEYRAFLDFPLDGSTGETIIPLNARIVSATLEIFINEVSFAPIVPALLDFVSYPIAGLRAEDFDSAPFLSQSLDFFASDAGQFVFIDVTPLMQEAQSLGLTDFQLRFVLDFDANIGFAGIEDLLSDPNTAPLLTVRYLL